MITARIISAYFICLAATVFTAAQALQDEVQLTTPTAPWTLVVEGKNLQVKDVKIKSTEESAYFLLYDGANEINFSFHIEPVDKCRTSDECRDHVLNVGNPAWGKFQDLAKGKIGEFSYFEFFRPEVSSLPLRILDMYAQYVDKGYWVDLHISKVLYKKEDHRLLENLVKAVKFVPRGTTPTSEAEKQRIKVEKVATDWLAISDSGRCRETYALLSPLSRDAVTAEMWLTYCRDGQTARGKLKERKLIASSFIKSLPSKPELTGAQFRYRSVFEKTGPVVEFVSFVLEPDGRWTVANYRVN